MSNNSIFYRTFFKQQGGNKKEKEKKEKEKKERKELISDFKNDLINLKNDSKLSGEDNAVAIDLKKISINKVFNVISKVFGKSGDYKENKILIRVGDNTYLTLNQTTLSEIKKLYKIVTDSTQGSDADFVRQMKDEIIYIERRKPPTEKEKKEQKGEGYDLFQGKEGAYWKYYNKVDFDFSRYGVFKKTEGDYKENCLFNALKNGGLDEVKQNDLRFIIRARNTPTNKLKKIAEQLDIYIILRKLSNRKKDKEYNKYQVKVSHYGDKTKKEYNIGLIDEHFFIIEKTNITKYALLHSEEIKHINKWNKIYKKYNNQYKKSNKRFIDSFDLMKTLLIHKDKLLEPIPYSDAIECQFYDKTNSYTSLDYNKNSVRLIKNKKKKKDGKEWITYYFDFETYTNEDKKHIPYLCCLKKQGEERTYTFIGEDCGLKLLNNIKDKYVVLVAHNCYYDFNFLIKYLKNVRNPILKGNGLISCEASFYGKSIRFKDSYKLITMPLSKFGKCFNLEQKKEIMPYDAYNIRNPLDNTYMDKEEFLSFIPEEDRDECLENCIKWDCYDEDDDEIDIIEYSKRYCEMDVIVLEKGYNKFREWMLELTELDINEQYTIAGLSYNYLKNQGCFNGCYELSGVPRDFIQKCVVGGRCMTNSNKKYRVLNNRIADFDAVSLYPSAMYRMPGFLKGIPKVLKNKSYDFLKSVDGYFIKIQILEVNIERHFPLMSKKNEEGIRLFSNNMEGKELYVDKITLEDLIKFQDIKFRIIEGYYFDEGRNPQIKKTILDLFNGRLQKKKEKNPIQVVYKLILNSAYGKTILKPIEDEVRIIQNDRFDSYLTNKYNHIKQASKIGDKYFVKEYKSINTHYNSAHMGVEVLSMSKRIMNEVMCLAEDNNIFMFYQDTDSIQLNYDDVKKLEKLFKEKYDRELTGKMLGQLHIDFEMHGVKDENTIYGRNAYYLGKKMYMVELLGKNEEGKEVIDYHIRMKGIPSSCIKYECRKNDISPLEIYEKLYNGEIIEFDLTQDGKKACFDFIKSEDGMIVKTKSEFSRKVKCVNEEGIIPSEVGRCTII